MAELNVQPKKQTNIIPWILLLLGIAALIWFLATRKGDDVAAVPATQDTGTNRTTTSNTANADWNTVDFNSPSVKYDEISDSNVAVRGTDGYGIYGLGENILFDEGKATIRPDAEANLKQVVASINKRYNGGDVRVYGYTDAKGSAGFNQDLAQQRADAVKAWLSANGIDGSKVTENAIGEARPVATNATEEGRQQNRRVEIVARGGSKQ